MEEKTLSQSNNSIVRPAVTPEEAVEAFKSYQELATKIVTSDDIQKIGNKDFKKKSFWRKCQRFFNLSLEFKSERREVNTEGAFTYFVVYRAIAPNGTFMDGDGACTSNEKGRVRTEHDTRSTAHTRAKNRAISDLVAFGEVSAEEMNSDDPYVKSDYELANTLSSMEVSQFQSEDKGLATNDHFCLIHHKPLKEYKPGTWDHRLKGFLQENKTIEYNTEGNWYWCQGHGWHLSASL